MLKEFCKIERLLPKEKLHKLPYRNPSFEGVINGGLPQKSVKSQKFL
jgi:hypothetical protein